MKNRALKISCLLLFVVLVSIGCKKEEVLPGKIYLTVTTATAFTYYDDNNSAIPYGFGYGTYYESQPGTYTYSAKIGNITWTNQTYTLSTPSNGKRRNYTLNFYSTGTGMASKLNYDDINQ